MDGWKIGATALAFAMTVGAVCAQTSVRSSNLAIGGLDSPGFLKRDRVKVEDDRLPAVPVRGNGWDPASPGTELGSTGIGADGRMVGPHAAEMHPDDVILRKVPGAKHGAAYPGTLEYEEATR